LPITKFIAMAILIAVLLIEAIAIGARVDVGVGLPAFGQTTATLTITTRYADGTPLSGMWTVLVQNGAVVANGFSPVTFSLSPGATYTVTTGNYQNITFYRWDPVLVHK
jgi:hypothetical protein